MQSTGSHNPPPEHRKYNFKFCSQDSAEIPVKRLLRDSFSCIGGIDANYTKENELHRTDCGGLTCMAHPAGKKLRTTPLQLRTLHKSQQSYGRAFHLHMRKRAKQNDLDPDLLCSRTVSFPLSYSLLGGALFVWLLKIVLSKQGYPRIF